MNEIVDYKVITYMTSDYMTRDVLKYVKMGFQLSGGVSASSNGFSQAMVKYKDIV